jgi:hypothetical protein
MAQLDPLLCTSIPVGITTQQLVDVVVKYGATFPELTHRPFTVLAMLQCVWHGRARNEPFSRERSRIDLNRLSE